jgi:hypothetical protein
MEHANRDEESCQKGRLLIDPIRQQVDESVEEREDAWASTVQEALKLFESMLSGKPQLSKEKNDSDENEELVVDLE